MDKQGYLLLVEDEPRIQKNNKKMLEREGHIIKQAYTLEEAWKIIDEELPRAIALDIQLPDGCGLAFLRKLREMSNVPVLVLTAMGTREDIIRGLETGGDDYLSKPYDLMEFLRRVEALLRRASIIPETLMMGCIKLDISSDKAYISGEDVCLSQKEFALLRLFLQHPRKLLEAKYIYEKIWGQELGKDSQALKKSISRLRTKLEKSEYTIFSERNEGYIFQ